MKKILGIGVFLFYFFYVNAQDPTTWQITDQDGLPSMTVYKTIQDHKGYIWMATARGITKYNGRKFTNIDLTGLVDREVLNIAEDSYGRIWFNNLSGQVGYVDGLDYKLFIPSNLDYDGSPLELSGRDSVFYATSKVSKKSENKITKLFIRNRNEITESIISTKNVNYSFFREYNNEWYSRNLLIDNHSVYASYISNDTISLKQFDFLDVKNKSIPSLEHVSESQVFYFSNNKWIIKCEAKQRSANIFYHAPHGLNSVIQLRGRLWAITQNGIFLININSNEVEDHWFKGVGINAVFQDSESNIWVSTSGGGVFVIPDLDITPYTELNSDLEKTDIHSLLLDSVNNELYIGTSGGFISRFNEEEKTFKTYKLPFSGRVKTIVKKDSKTLFVGLDDGLCSFDINTNTHTVLNQTMAVKVAEIDDDNLWLGTSSNIYEIPFEDLDTINQNGLRDLFSNKRTYAIYNDLEDVVWIGTTNGLYAYENDTLNPLIIDGVNNAYSVNAIDQSLDSSLWVATSGNGLIELNNREFKNVFTKDNILPSNNCRSLVLWNNFIYVGTDNGLVSYNTKDRKSEIFTVNDGLPSAEINTLSVDSLSLFIGTPKGLVVLDKSKIKNTNINSPIFLTDININGRDTVFQEEYNLDYQDNVIDINYTALNFRSRGNEKYSYRLVGLGSNWLTTSARVARFHSLSPGKYEFQVQMINEFGKANSDVAKVSFYIKQAWWKTTEFYIVGFLFLLLLASSLIYWRLRDLRKREKKESELDMRIQSLRIEALRTQMNPHFIYNALNAIQDFFVTYDEKSGLIYLSKFAHLIRQIFENSSRSLISLREEIDFLKLYLDLEKLRFGDKVNVHFEIDEKLKGMLDYIEIPPLLIQPSIENAFKHGLMHKLEKGNLYILFELKNEEIVKCTIHDDGVGRAFIAIGKIRSTKNRTISALEATKSRLAMWKPESAIKEKLVIQDLKSADGIPIGTKVEIYI